MTRRAILLTIALVIDAKEGGADPRMISYQYANCAVCHISPQGRHLLNEYGAGVDEAQSVRASEVGPGNTLALPFGDDAELTHDVRLRLLEVIPTDRNVDDYFRADFRNSLAITASNRFSSTIGVQTPSQGSEAISPYYTQPSQGTLVSDKAVWQFRPWDGLELDVGRDRPPSGINFSDLTAFVRSRNRMGVTDYPTQVKLFEWADHHQLQAYAFGPGGNQKSRHEEWGAGGLAELDVGDQNAVIGLQAVVATSDALDRQLLGAYARWGITERYGLLLEHDVTRRSLDSGSKPNFYQFATYAKLYWTPWEWMVNSLVLQQLKVEDPFEETAYRVAVEHSIRWSRNLTTSIAFSHDTNNRKEDVTAFILRVAFKRPIPRTAD